MTPKETAEFILDECYRLELETVYYGVNNYLAKKFCDIAIEAGLEFEKKMVKDLEILCKEMNREFKFEGYFWDEVKQEIEKL
jgi:hypothetical protein